MAEQQGDSEVPGAAEASPAPSEWSRVACPSCGKSGKFYCPYCCVILGQPKDTTIPTPQLPIGFDLIFKDKIEKSTGLHAKCLCPAAINVLDYDHPEDLPDYQVESAVVGYPADDAVALKDMTSEELSKVQTVILIDSAWKKSKVTERTVMLCLPTVLLTFIFSCHHPDCHRRS